MDIIDASPRALALIDPTRVSIAPVFINEKTRYPLGALEVGQAIALDTNEVNESSIRVMASAFGKRYNRKLTVIKHVALKKFEIARIA